MVRFFKNNTKLLVGFTKFVATGKVTYVVIVGLKNSQFQIEQSLIFRDVINNLDISDNGITLVV